MGQNELDTIQVCLGYVGAQEDYLAMNPDGSSVPHYADRLFSSPGTRNGLYWETKPGEPQSPLGPAVSGAVSEGYTPKSGKRQPYHGYLFRLLEAQGSHAEGGAMSYRENGALVRGYGLVGLPGRVRDVGSDDLRGEPGGRRLPEGPRAEDRQHRRGDDDLRPRWELDGGREDRRAKP